MEFEIGLAYKSGKLTGKDQSRIQRWALGYYQFCEKRDQVDSQFEIKRLLHFILRGVNSKLYEFAYPSVEADDPDVIPGHTYTSDDLEGLEQVLKDIGTISKRRTQVELSKREWTDWR